ncbi:MAG TPA: gamma-glutamylcyclotransferase family protein [Bryobacteraceae bacterium]|nr:gamma-glutamylcyclotransferase family protein [Bryobacteraceae bacterium]
MEDLKLLFVYGTLKSGCSNQYADLLHSSSDFMGRASIAGRLYRIAEYPGAVLSDNPADRVHGEVFQMHDSDALLEALDAYEGSTYERVWCPIEMEDGEQATAWVYTFRESIEGKPRIKSGDFLV